ncbi:MAG: acylneuraminate cytidylyltransferase family protein [Candidatus Brocadiales bacterium]|nr:acylneuraminate cytidylyltransferase family protein [Candidatus Brocadiales bacterium]
MNILAVIPARGGSKGVKNKNLLKIGRYTLVERALFTAIGCKQIDRIVVTSDVDDIIALVNQYGDYAPFKRPPELATDMAGSHGVIKHALEWVEEDNKKYDYIVLLEPPAPFRLPEHIEIALEIAFKTNASSVMSVVEVGDYHPIRMKKMDNNGVLTGFCEKEPDGIRRQDQEPVYIRNSAVYVFSRSTILSGQLWGSVQYGYLMKRNLYGINIDEPIDVITAKAFYNEMQKKKKNLKLIEYIPAEIDLMA